MLARLRQLPPLASCQEQAKPKKNTEKPKKKSKNLIKIEPKESSSSTECGQSINPISRLIQIQQAKKEKDPVYTLVAEKGMPRKREFLMQVGKGG